MAAYSLFLKEVSVNEGTVEGGGTALEAIGKEAVEPANPAITPLVKTTAAAGKKVETKGFVVPGELATELAGGGKVTAATLHISMKTGSAGLRLKFGFVTAAVFTEPSITTAQAWYTVSLSKAQAEALTKTGLEELLALAEHITTAGALSIYEIYLSVESEAGGGGVTGLLATSASAMTIGGTAKIGGRGGLRASTSAAQIGSTAKISARAGLATKASAVVIGGAQAIKGITSSATRKIVMLVFDE